MNAILRSASVLLAAALVSALAIGCSGKADSSASSDSKSTETPAPAPQAPAAPQPTMSKGPLVKPTDSASISSQSTSAAPGESRGPDKLRETGASLRRVFEGVLGGGSSEAEGTGGTTPAADAPAEEGSVIRSVGNALGESLRRTATGPNSEPSPEQPEGPEGSP